MQHERRDLQVQDSVCRRDHEHERHEHNRDEPGHLVVCVRTATLEDPMVLRDGDELPAHAIVLVDHRSEAET